ncbi:hypothetical protein CALVIDRAFT_524427 [Calocera viscosa TUFC12733]|uniref:Uncharacterized protein n=1 Tax=Calocera viscosa (strain TUFC12733) TaxID=1330018 RepID=A0A167RX21_CALVF|nr:hypothetical protein CALVIDRAFT_524427 [Calocera viscosa TUFC12733]
MAHPFQHITRFDPQMTEVGGRLHHENGQRVPLHAARTVPLVILDQWFIVRPSTEGTEELLPWHHPGVAERPFVVDGTAHGPFNTDLGLQPRVIVYHGTAPEAAEDLHLIGTAYLVPTMGEIPWQDAFFHLTALRRQAIVDRRRSHLGSPLELRFPGFTRSTRCVETSGRYYQGGWHTAISIVLEYLPEIALALHNPAPYIEQDFEHWVRHQTPRLDLPIAEFVPYSWSPALNAPPGYLYPLVAEFLEIREQQGRSHAPMSIEELQMYSASILISLRGGPVSIYLGDTQDLDDGELEDDDWNGPEDEETARALI